MKHITIAEYKILRTYRNFKIVKIDDQGILIKFI